jgi:transposase
MKRKPAAPVFKPYIMHQIQLMPPSYEEVIEEKHLVRTVNEAIDKIDLDPLLAQYKGGGTSSYNPKMMMKVLVYAYSQKVYSSRRIAKGLRENIHFMWISGGNRPDFRTINEFRSSRLKPVIDEVFHGVMEYLVEGGHVKLEHYFVDGTKIEANANKHKVVWAKGKEHHQKRVRQQIDELMRQIERENEAEQEEYGERDLEELGGNTKEDINSERLKKKIADLNERIRARVKEQEDVRSDQKVIKKLEKESLPRLEKYENQERLLAGRNSYSRTDPDASCMQMKEDRGAEKAWPKPAYNVQAGTEGQFIVGFSVHQRAGDTNCLIPHLEGVRKGLKRLPKRIVSDAGYGSEENYAYLEEHSVENYLKYNTFYQDTHKYKNQEMIRKQQFKAENFPYDAGTDQFTCPADKRLSFISSSSCTTENGHEIQHRNYECSDGMNCPLKAYCSRSLGNRKIRINFQLLEYRRQARENLTSEEGKRLRTARSTEVETVFGHLKHNMGFRRFHLRGIEKVKTELGILSIAHNMQKLASI